MCRSDSWLADIYATSPVMSTYLLCVIVGEFAHVEAKWHNVTTYPVRCTTYFRYGGARGSDAAVNTSEGSGAPIKCSQYPMNVAYGPADATATPSFFLH